jgi:hypothetical protein
LTVGFGQAPMAATEPASVPAAPPELLPLPAPFPEFPLDPPPPQPTRRGLSASTPATSPKQARFRFRMDCISYPLQSPFKCWTIAASPRAREQTVGFTVRPQNRHRGTKERAFISVRIELSDSTVLVRPLSATVLVPCRARCSARSKAMASEALPPSLPRSRGFFLRAKGRPFSEECRRSDPTP